MANKSNQAYKIAMVGLLAALSYVVFTYGQVKITLPGGDATSIHLGNAVCVIGALLVGGFYGGLGGAIGMTIGDLLDPVYIVYAPKTFICKLCIGLIAGFVAHRLGKIDRSTDKNHILGFTIAAAVAGLLFNVIADPLIGYYYKLWIIGGRAHTCMEYRSDFDQCGDIYDCVCCYIYGSSSGTPQGRFSGCIVCRSESIRQFISVEKN